MFGENTDLEKLSDGFFDECKKCYSALNDVGVAVTICGGLTLGMTTMLNALKVKENLTSLDERAIGILEEQIKVWSELGDELLE